MGPTPFSLFVNRIPGPLLDLILQYYLNNIIHGASFTLWNSWDLDVGFWFRFMLSRKLYKKDELGALNQH